MRLILLNYAYNTIFSTKVVLTSTGRNIWCSDKLHVTIAHTVCVKDIHTV